MSFQKINNIFKLHISYILFNSFYKFLSFKFEKFNNNCIFVKNNKLYYTLIHCRLATNLYIYQLSDMFTYEIFLKHPKLKSSNSASSNNVKLLNTSTSCVVVYNLHNLVTNNRAFIFSKTLTRTNSSNVASTIAELYTNASWLEREVAELHGLQFAFKKDLRNLMLQYGDTSAPLKKIFPSIGFRETSYDVLSDSVVQNRLDVQN
jgi:NADH:ubiquinone oxidoreductase subunit C